MECVADVRAVLGEGPVWVSREQALYWVDIVGRRLFRWSEAAGLHEYERPPHLCSLAPRAAGGFVGAGPDGFLVFDPEQGGGSSLGDPEAAVPGNRFNDGKVDRGGRFWAGTMDRHEREATGSLYRLDLDLTWVRGDGDYHVTNGPAFSLDGGTMYHNDSALRRVYAFDLDVNGLATNRRLFVQFEEKDGYPDGMTVDAENCLWIAFWDGWCVRRISPSGERLDEIRIPAQRPTSCAFGGPNLDRLFVTSARRGLDADQLALQPNAGGLFMAVPGVGGVAETLFAG
jgi:sugar lactone lactonase YvrE